MNELRIVNLSAYKFIALSEADLPLWREKLLGEANTLSLKGTVLISTEGINVFVAGPRESVDAFKQYLDSIELFAELPYKESLSHDRPFTRMLVRIKKEIIPMSIDSVKPGEKTAHHLDPREFKQWYEEGKDMIVLDTRNDYEIRLGTFDQAIHLNIKNFREFPEALNQLPEAFKEKPVVTFCTGGIRCEKAAELMAQNGFKEVYQLDGGILKYFEECGDHHYHCECFVFDKRVAVDASLKETHTVQCYACRSPITVEEQTSCEGRCPYCGHTEFLKALAHPKGEQAH